MLLLIIKTHLIVYIGMCPIPHTSAYRSKSKLLETDGDRRIMLKMGPVHDRDNGQGVSGTELERTARYRDLLYARIGVEYRRSCRNRPRACAYPTGINRSRGASTPPRNPWWPPADPSRMWPRVTRYDHHKHETIRDPSVFPKLGAS